MNSIDITINKDKKISINTEDYPSVPVAEIAKCIEANKCPDKYLESKIANAVLGELVKLSSKLFKEHLSYFTIRKCILIRIIRSRINSIKNDIENLNITIANDSIKNTLKNDDIKNIQYYLSHKKIKVSRVHKLWDIIMKNGLHKLSMMDYKILEYAFEFCTAYFRFMQCPQDLSVFAKETIDRIACLYLVILSQNIPIDLTEVYKYYFKAIPYNDDS